jgi:glycosyltransferase involved in cell wall biosynthesis
MPTEKNQEKKLLKILHIITKGSPFGGAQKYLYELATSLPQDQFESVVLVGQGEELPKKLETQHIRIIRLSDLGRDINVLSEFKVFWQLVHILKTEQPHVVHLNSSKIGGLGALAVRFVNLLSYSKILNLKSKIYCIYTAHGWAFNEKRSTFELVTIQFLSWITIMLCHTVIVIAKNEEAQALNMPFTQGKVKLVYNGIEKIDFKTKTEARNFLLEKHPDIPPHSTWIGTVAELHKNKNLSSAITALRDIPGNIVFLIIGEGEERKHLTEQIKIHDLDKKVFLLGKIENAGTYLKAFDTTLHQRRLTIHTPRSGLSLPSLSLYLRWWNS